MILMAINYEVKQGDCISSIAFEHGLLPNIIWDHANNAELKSKRKNPNILLPGDVVFVPDKRLKEVSEPTNQVHKFKFQGAPAKLNLKLLDDGEPISNEPFVLDINGKITEGTTDHEGRIRVSIVPNAESGELIVGTGKNRYEYSLDLGWLDPIEQVSGVKKRLHNLGYEAGIFDERITDELADALTAFEFDHKLEQTGQITEKNRTKLKEVYGC